MTHIVERPASQAKTCTTCPYFDNFKEANGRGWCNQFNHQAREHHKVTNDCILSSDLAVSVELKDNLDIFSDIDLEELEAFPTEEIVDPADLPQAEYQIGSIVKVIDSQEHHSEWAVFEVAECFHNSERYRTTEAYMSETDWYYTISSIDGVTQLEVSEIEICDSDISEHVCTEDIF